MPGVETKHPQYEHVEYQWRQLRDSAAGTSSIKRSGSLYLPIPAAMLDNPSQSAGVPTDSGNFSSGNIDKNLTTSAPWFHSNAAYSAYLQRARFPDMVSSCLRGFVGISTKKNPIVELPASIDYLEDRATNDGMSLNELYKKVVQELLLTGRYSLLLDINETGQINIVSYNAESFTNWKQGVIKGESATRLAVFQECFSDCDDQFSHDLEDAFRVLFINDDGIYESAMFVDGKAQSSVIPNLMGQAFDRLPLVTMNATKIGCDIGPSPMLGISDIAISVYQKEADISHSEFLTCNPTLVVTGIDEDQAPGSVGSSVCWAFPNSEVKVFYVEPESNCFQHMSSRIQDLFKEATAYGSALLGESKKAAESSETVRLRQEASGATLKSIVGSAKEGIERALKMAAIWSGADPGQVSFRPNMEFSEFKLTAQEQNALLQAWMNGAISHDTYLYNLQEASVIPEDVNVEEEKGRIETTAPVLVG